LEKLEKNSKQKTFQLSLETFQKYLQKMPMFWSIISYVFLFLALCITFFLGLVLYNLFTKSYKPQNSLLIIGIITILFVLNLVMGFARLQATLTILEKSSQPKPITTRF